ncbi:OmpA family protein [Spirosoma radiotolerans]|uniref:Signaling protein n=1 Tax=Spirosoma radiotolerans TaxID=1379870 RepID=A0A0E3ZYD0_9BACT|nr:PA14 domain-containing protein [Spirosoma radiotolerans]AKD57639.1 signaling protein [Spirosoma radiotolerans]
MKTLTRLLGLSLCLTVMSVRAQQGLKGDYYTGTNFEKKVFTRMDPQLNYNWRGRNPAPGLSESFYSIRWTGKLLAPASGVYRFYAKVDDGIRIWVGNKLVVNSWQLNDSKDFSGSILLEAGQFYDLRVDYFNDMLEGEIYLYWQRPDAKKTSLNPFNTPGELITTQYFFQKPLPSRVSLIRTPPPAVPKPPVAVVKTPAKINPTTRVAKTIPKPALSPPSTKTVTANAPVLAPPITRVEPEPIRAFEPGATVVLHKVQFEQSSYILLPESSTELDQLVIALKKNPLWQITIAGHTDNIGDPRLNLALSENRAKVVAAYLKRRGVADDRIITNGYGGTHPIADNALEIERSKNRRVEITLKDEKK